jgi:predicted CxxxxCH...CXXCH cytochrome family protein
MRGRPDMRIVAAVAAVLFSLWGCSKANDGGILDASGKHPANWVAVHGDFFRTIPGAVDNAGTAASTRCTECHGNDLKGGISKVSCFSTAFGALTCHFHPAGFRDPANHGATAKGAGTFKGLVTCQGCHGSGYTGGFLSNVSCFSASSPVDPAFTCHGVPAPHARAWATSVTSDHSTTDQSNAPQCAPCHAGGGSLTTLPKPVAPPAGTPPGCFNGSLCHYAIGHPAGWADPAQHGAAAKSQPGTSSGFPSCQSCHGADLRGGIAGVSCFLASTAAGSCHVRSGTATPTGAPHAQVPWILPGLTHTSTVDDTQGLNAALCAQCHLHGNLLRVPILNSYASGTPGCFNATLCHDQNVGHPAGWADPTRHGATAKADLTFCQRCHSNNPLGGAGSNPRFNVPLGNLVNGCEDCHAPFAAHPPVLQIPAAFGVINNPDPLGTKWYRHRTSTNFGACNRCHGANLDGVGAVPGAPSCTSCHRSGLPTTLKNCTSCHGKPPVGTVYPNIASAHPAHTTLNVADLCGECHLGFGSGTLLHFQKAALQPAPQVASMAFGTLSKTGGVVPVYNSANQQCTNVYCHGVTLSGGTNKAPVWNDAAYLTAAGCGTCHGFPPANAAHVGFTSATHCNTCHKHVNGTNDGFIDPTKHVNGVIDVTAGIAHAFPFPGASHKSTTGATIVSTCVTCHAIGVAGASYPAATAGAPPDCRSCHLNADPGPDPQCSDCHGSAANNAAASAGRPNNSPAVFPNIARNHTAGRHAVACSICHSGGGPGTAAHGSSNHTARTTPAQVKVTFATGADATVTGMVFTVSGASGRCSGTCHNNLTNQTHTHNGETW